VRAAYDPHAKVWWVEDRSPMLSLNFFSFKLLCGPVG
jgi:hypothetical protein